jgi:hypothetical protein
MNAQASEAGFAFYCLISNHGSFFTNFWLERCISFVRPLVWALRQKALT